MPAQLRPAPRPVAPSPFNPSSVRADRFKRACDMIFGAGLALATCPVILVIWTLVRATSSGPGFYSQVRVGRGNRNYRIYKIRTMAHNCEAGSGVKWSTKGDSRVTPVGRILRKLHLDEIPQLWNVLKGDMSLVGPRPERPEFVVPLSAEIEGYPERHQVRPGVTGLAQIQLPADSDVESVRTKLVLDRYYVEHASLWLDLRIMFGTLVYLVGFSYAQVRRLMRLPNPLTEAPPPTGSRTRSAIGGARVVLRHQPAPTRKDDIAPALVTEGGAPACGGAR